MKEQDLASLIILCPGLTCGSEYIILCGSDGMYCGCVEKHRGKKSAGKREMQKGSASMMR